MRILFCNKYNYPFSGTEVYLFELMALMRERGHEVALFSMADPRGETTPHDRWLVPPIDFKGNQTFWHKLRQAPRAIYSADARRRIREMIREFRPHVAHVRNIYHHLSPSILWELKTLRVPVLYHLNDFKLLCPAYNLVSQGEACEKCKGGAFYKVLRSPCYPGAAARATLMAEAYFHRWIGTYRRCVDRFLAPSRFVRDKFVEHGWDGGKFDVLPHFQKAAERIDPPDENAPVLYFGRLSREKGVADLVRAMQALPHLRLVIAGDGPERDELQKLADSLQLSNVQFAGHVGGTELDALICRSRFTVLPSHAYETLGKTILESYARGRAVIASDTGSRRELIHEGETGLLYPVGDVVRLADSIRRLATTHERSIEMGRAGWEMIRERYTPQAHYQNLLSCYNRIASTGPGRAANHPPEPQIVADDGQKCGLRVAFIGGRGVVSKYSGIETYYEEVGSYLVELGHDVTLYCRSYFTPPLDQYKGMRLVRLPTIRSKHLETAVHTLLSTLHVSMQPCDIVHYHTLGPSLLSFLPRWFGKKTVVTVQGLDWKRKKWGRLAAALLRVGERAAVLLPDRTMVVSQTLQKYYAQRYEAATCFIPNGGILRDQRRPQKILEWGLQPGNYILFLGRFSPEKNCHLLIEAFNRLDTSAKLVMAGASTHGDAYIKRLRAHAGEKIKLLDPVAGNSLDELLTNAMIFVLPSDLEGFSLALLDAMGAGLCVLASDVPENREAVDGAGFTFERGNVADLADRLRFLVANPKLREAAGKIARERIRERYLWPGITREIEKAYLSVVEGRPFEQPCDAKPPLVVANQKSPTSERIAG